MHGLYNHYISSQENINLRPEIKKEYHDPKLNQTTSDLDLVNNANGASGKS